MKIRFAFLGLILLLFSVLVPVTTTKAQDIDYVAAAVAGLRTSNVYVYPSTPGTDYNTENNLKRSLLDSDGIVLIILPSDALKDTDVRSIAQKISSGLNNQKTIGLAVGNELFGYSIILPEGVAYDKMERASTVSIDPITALTIFTQNIHAWQTYNPQSTPTPSPEPTRTPRPTPKPIELPKIDTSKTSGKVSMGLIYIVALVVMVLLLVKLIPWLRRQFKFTPASNTLSTIENLLGGIENRRVVTELTKACKLAHGLIRIYRNSSKYTGKGEDLFPVLLNNIVVQVKALITHESGTQPLDDQLLTPMIRTLLNYDDMFKKLQENDPEVIALMAANFMSENTMISHLGYLEK